MKLLRILAFVLSIAPAACFAQNQIAKQVDPIVQQDMAADGIPGVAVAFVHNNQVLYSQSYGMASTPGGAPVDSHTAFCLGPISSALTAFAAMELAESGKLRLDDAIGTYLSDLPKSWKSITVLQLLTQRSGIPAMPAGGTKDWDSILDGGDGKPFAFSPGTSEQYNPMNYEIMGKVIEAASGETYAGFMRRHVFKPLGMADSGAALSGKDAALGYTTGASGPTPARGKHYDYEAPTNGLYASLADLIAWEQRMFAANILDKAHYQTMFRPNGSETGRPGYQYSIGWRARLDRGDLVVSEIGGGPGYSSAMIIDLNRGDAMILLRNSTGKRDLNPLSRQLFKTVFGQPAVVRAARPPRAVRRTARRKHPWF